MPRQSQVTTGQRYRRCSELASGRLPLAYSWGSTIAVAIVPGLAHPEPGRGVPASVVPSAVGR
jgi:hypothetical protein